MLEERHFGLDPRFRTWEATCENCGWVQVVDVPNHRKPIDCFAGWKLWIDTNTKGLDSRALCPDCARKETAQKGRKCKDCAHYHARSGCDGGRCHHRALIGDFEYVGGRGPSCSHWTARREARIAAGVCSQCGQPCEPAFASCDECAKALSEANREKEREMASVFDVTVYEKVYDEESGLVAAHQRVKERADVQASSREGAIQKVLQEGTLADYDLGELLLTVVERELRPFAT